MFLKELEVFDFNKPLQYPNQSSTMPRITLENSLKPTTIYPMPPSIQPPLPLSRRQNHLDHSRPHRHRLLHRPKHRPRRRRAHHHPSPPRRSPLPLHHLTLNHLPRDPFPFLRILNHRPCPDPRDLLRSPLHNLIEDIHSVILW